MSRVRSPPLRTPGRVDKSELRSQPPPPTPWDARSFFVRASLFVNIVVLIGVCAALGFYGTAPQVVTAWGPASPARGILLSIYCAILIVSTVLLTLDVRFPGAAAVEYMVVALLATQVLYKVSTPATAGVTNPVAVCNVVVGAFHALTLYLLWRGRALRAQAAGH